MRCTVALFKESFTMQAKKTRKPSKTRLTSGKRYFPKWNENMSAREYIEAYFNANNHVYGNNTGCDVYRSLFASA